MDWEKWNSELDAAISPIKMSQMEQNATAKTEEEDDAPIKRVMLQNDANTACLLHALTTEREEVMGLLIGYRRKGTVIVVSTLQLSRTDKRKDRVEIAEEQLATASDVAEQRTEQLRLQLGTTDSVTLTVVGWYHSHPHITVYPSHVDVATQKRFEQMHPGFVGLIYGCFDQTNNNFPTDNKAGSSKDTGHMATGGRHRTLAFQSNPDYDMQIMRQYSDEPHGNKTEEPPQDYKLLSVSVISAMMLRNADKMLGFPLRKQSKAEVESVTSPRLPDAKGGAPPGMTIPWWGLAATDPYPRDRHGVPGVNVVESVVATASNVIEEAKLARDTAVRRSADVKPEDNQDSLADNYNATVLAKEACRIDRFITRPTLRFLEDSLRSEQKKKQTSDSTAAI